MILVCNIMFSWSEEQAYASERLCGMGVKSTAYTLYIFCALYVDNERLTCHWNNALIWEFKGDLSPLI